MIRLHEIEFSIAINSEGVCYITQKGNPAEALEELGTVEGLGAAVHVYNVKLRVPLPEPIAVSGALPDQDGGTVNLTREA